MSSIKTGDAPRSIRKRGFHRALKRKESWAVLKKQMQDLNEMVRDYYTADQKHK